MNTAVKEQLADAWHTLAPRPDDDHGRLPALLILLTVVTGLVDAFSYLTLGRVFVANMTGNVVFLAFDFGGAPGFIWWASLLAILMFVAGAFIGGRIAHTHGQHRGRHLLIGAAVQAAMVTPAFLVALLFPNPYGDVAHVILIVLLGLGMGLQNATARALGVPDLTTTVLTLTLTGISADSVAAGGKNSKAGRRLVSVVSMFLGAIIGTLLVRNTNPAWTLLLAAALLLTIVAVTRRTISTDPPWAAQR